MKNDSDDPTSPNWHGNKTTRGRAGDQDDALRRAASIPEQETLESWRNDSDKDARPPARTRLDEIVEEELASWTGDLLARTAEGKRIAKRAFRHGVERSIEQWRDLEDGLDERVQPAPAGSARA